MALTVYCRLRHGSAVSPEAEFDASTPPLPVAHSVSSEPQTECLRRDAPSWSVWLTWPGDRRWPAYVVLALVTTGIVAASLSYEPLGIPGRRAGQIIPLAWSATQVEQWAGGADVGSYVRGAKYFLEHGRFYASTINLWPPGHPFFVAMLMRYTGEEYYAAKILVLNVALWIVAFGFVYTSLHRLRYGLVRIGLTLSPLYFATIREWLFGYGLLGSESFATPLFVIAICCCLHWIRAGRRSSIVAFAVALAALAYLRGYFEMFGNVLLVAVATLVFTRLAYGVVAVFRESGRSPLRAAWAVVRRPWRHTGPRTHDVVIASLVFVLLLLPWRLYNLERGNSLAWLHANYYWTRIWEPDSAANRLYVKLGINIPCHVDAPLCEALHAANPFGTNARLAQRFYKRLTVVTFLTNPVAWYAHRAGYFDVFWFGSTWDALFTRHRSRLFEGSLLLGAAFASFAISAVLVWRRDARELRRFMMFVGLFLVFNLALFTFLHLQFRYSIFLRIVCAYLPMWIAACALELADSPERARPDTEPVIGAY